MIGYLVDFHRWSRRLEPGVEKQRKSETRASRPSSPPRSFGRVREVRKKEAELEVLSTHLLMPRRALEIYRTEERGEREPSKVDAS